jgi:hypothetical protein
LSPLFTYWPGRIWVSIVKMENRIILSKRQFSRLHIS